MEEKYTTCSPVSQPIAWLIWAFVTLFYFYEYFLRTAPSVMENELSHFFSISAAGLGSLIGAYYYTYAPLQIVAGVAMDRYGGRKVVPLAVLLCAIGSWLFTMPNLGIALLGRMLIGAGSACGFISVIFIATNWIPRQHLALLTGLTQTLGMLGAILGQKYVVLLMQNHIWQTVWQQCVVAGIGLAIILFFIIPKRPVHVQQRIKAQGYAHVLQNLKLVVCNKQTWLAGIFGGCIFLPTTVLAMIWAVPFFESAYHLSLQKVTSLTSILFIGWIIGSPLMGFISDRLGSRKYVMVLGVLLTFLCVLAIVYIPNLPYYLLLALMFLIGIFSGTELVAIAFTCEANPIFAKGAAIGITNFIIFTFSAILSPLVGVLLNRITGAHALITAQDYQLSFLIIPVCLLLALICILYATEPEAKQDILSMEH